MIMPQLTWEKHPGNRIWTFAFELYVDDVIIRWPNFNVNAVSSHGAAPQRATLTDHASKSPRRM